MNRSESHYRWVICFSCFWLFLCNMGLCSNILTVYLPFIEEKGFTDSMGSAILSVRSLFSFLTTFLVEFYYRKLSLRKGILIASLVGAAAPVLFSIGTLPVYYYIGAALAGIIRQDICSVRKKFRTDPVSSGKMLPFQDHICCPVCSLL